MYMTNTCIWFKNMDEKSFDSLNMLKLTIYSIHIKKRTLLTLFIQYSRKKYF